MYWNDIDFFFKVLPYLCIVLLTPSNFQDKIDLSDPIIMGHSFGGATSMYTLAMDQRFKYIFPFLVRIIYSCGCSWQMYSKNVKSKCSSDLSDICIFFKWKHLLREPIAQQSACRNDTSYSTVWPGVDSTVGKWILFSGSVRSWMLSQLIILFLKVLCQREMGIWKLFDFFVQYYLTDRLCFGFFFSSNSESHKADRWWWMQWHPR